MSEPMHDNRPYITEQGAAYRVYYDTQSEEWAAETTFDVPTRIVCGVGATPDMAVQSLVENLVAAIDMLVTKIDRLVGSGQ